MKILDLMSSSKVLGALLAISLLVIIVGLLVIQLSQGDLTQQREQAALSAAQQLAKDAVQQLAASTPQATDGVHLDTLMQDVKPDIYTARVAALNGRTPELGSEDWCAVMMVKDADAWTETEQQLFAKNCL